MRPLTLTVLSVVPVLALTACAELNKPSQANQEVHRHWSSVQARIKYQLAVDSFQAGQLEQSDKYLQESIGLDANVAAPYMLLAKILLERGEIATARETLEEAARRGGDDPPMDYLRGVIAERYGRFEDALAWYRRASDRDAMNAHYVVAVGETLVALGRFDDALALAREHWTDFEQNATLRAMAAGVYTLLGRYEEAADAYHEAVRIAPEDDLVQWQFGSALVRAGRCEEACVVLAAATSEKKEVPPSALIDLGRCHLELNRPDEAKAVLRRAVAGAPQNATAWNWLARAALASDDLLTARRAGTRAVDLKPADSEHAVLLAYVCWRQRDFPAVDRVLAHVLDNQPNDPVALYLRSKAHEAMGQTYDGQRGHRMALRLPNLGQGGQGSWVLQRPGNGSPGHDRSTPDGRARAP